MRTRAALVVAAILATGCVQMGNRPQPSGSPGRWVEEGYASWYGMQGGKVFEHGKLTASGKRFDMNAMTAAHKTLPLGTRVKVTNLENGKTILVVINDRGPYIDGRIIDLTLRGARILGFKDKGSVKVRIEAQP